MAKNLSLQGRDMNERMKECHREVKIPIYIMNLDYGVTGGESYFFEKK